MLGASQSSEDPDLSARGAGVAMGCGRRHRPRGMVANTLLPGTSKVRIRRTAPTKSDCWFSKGRRGVEGGGQRSPSQAAGETWFSTHSPAPRRRRGHWHRHHHAGTWHQPGTTGPGASSAQDEGTDPMSLSSPQACSWTRHVHVAESLPLISAWPQIYYSQQRVALIPSCSHPAALLSPRAVMSPPLSQGESQTCPQPLLGGLSFARPPANGGQRVNG